MAHAIEDELFLMANLFPKHTGLPFVVWISTGQGVQHDVRVKVSRGTRVIPADMITVGLRPGVRVVNGELKTEELDALRQWIELNREALVAYWNEEIDTPEVLERLRKI